MMSLLHVITSGKLEFEELRTKIAKSRKEFVDEYNRLHAVCPKCGSEKRSMSVTYMGHDLSFDEDGNVTTKSHVDENYANCKCGWAGTVHDLVPINSALTQN